MLVLTRKLNEQIRIGDDVTITVIRVKGNTVRLGIDAPRTTRVVRGELEPFDQAPGIDAAPAASHARSSVDKPASAGKMAASVAGKRTASPLAAYMPSNVSCLTADLSA